MNDDFRLAQGRLPSDLVIGLREKVVAEIQAAGYHEGALDIGLIVEHVIRREWGGRPLYIANGTRYHTEWMREQVRARWTGRNTGDLCIELNISETRLRQLAKQVRENEQPGLFES